MANSVALLNTKAPFSSAIAKESLDLALIFGSYEQSPSLFFCGDGVFQLIENQSPELINSKDFLKTFAAFEFYDIENIYVCKASLNERNLAETFHLPNVQILETSAFIIKLNSHQTILKF